MGLNEFNCYYLNLLLEKLAKEQKTVFLLGDSNVDLLKYENICKNLQSFLEINSMQKEVLLSHKLRDNAYEY